jgi:ribose-phosphate pyrophosphokinase
MIVGIGFNFHKFVFPCGEPHIKLFDYEPGHRVSLHFIYQKAEDIIDLLLVCDALKRENMILEGIAMPYVPFGRQDRVNVAGEPLSIKVFADLINSCGAKVVEITDPHSDVTTVLIKNVKVKHQHEVFDRFINGREPFFLISPDAGALKKIYKLAEKLKNCYEVVQCSKIRNVVTGEITGVEVHRNNFVQKDCVIVDDICDGGRTFVEIAKVLKTLNCGKIILCVTHGFFTKGLEVFNGLIDEIYTMNGKIK